MQKAVNNLVSLIKSDHKVVSGLFTKFQATKNPIERKDLVNTIVKELSIHSAAEGK
jgi:hemerythrin superfamily protein